jgi:hypothetical protein
MAGSYENQKDCYVFELNIFRIKISIDYLATTLMIGVFLHQLRSSQLTKQGRHQRVTFRMTGFLDFIHCPEFEILENNVRELDLFRVRFEVFTAVTLKNGVFWDVTPRGSISFLLPTSECYKLSSEPFRVTNITESGSKTGVMSLQTQLVVIMGYCSQLVQ